MYITYMRIKYKFMNKLVPWYFVFILMLSINVWGQVAAAGGIVLGYYVRRLVVGIDTERLV